MPVSALTTKKYTLSRELVLEQFTADIRGEQQVHVKNDRNRLGFFACLSGNSRIRLNNGQETFQIGRGACGVYTEAKGLDSVAEYDTKEPYSIISITMPPSAPRDLFGIDMQLLPFSHGADESAPGYDVRFLPLSRNVHLSFQAIIAPSIHKQFLPVYMECKVLEILAVMLSDMYSGRCESQASPALSSKEIAKIQTIRDLLIENISDSPSVIELARSFGFTHNKLNQGFKELFGGTVYEYLREQRLHKARELLLSGDYNVTEACLEVGYTNLSHFAKMYRKKFGQNPSNSKKYFPSA